MMKFQVVEVKMTLMTILFLKNSIFCIRALDLHRAVLKGGASRTTTKDAAKPQPGLVLVSEVE